MVFNKMRSVYYKNACTDHYLFAPEFPMQLSVQLIMTNDCNWRFQNNYQSMKSE